MTQNQLIHQQVRDILKLTLDHNVRMAEKSPAVRMGIAMYGEPLTKIAERISNFGKRLN